jgi:hypothetical protein
MLAVWLSKQPSIPASIARHMDRGGGPMKIDGHYGEQTKAWIAGFEEWANDPRRSRVLVVADGRIDPLSQGMSTGDGKSKKMWLLTQEVAAAGRYDGGIMALDSPPVAFPRRLVSQLLR